LFVKNKIVRQAEYRKRILKASDLLGVVISLNQSASKPYLLSASTTAGAGKVNFFKLFYKPHKQSAYKSNITVLPCAFAAFNFALEGSSRF